MNVILRGKTKEIVESMVREGYANTLSEAVRLAIVNFEQKCLMNEAELVSKKLDRIDQEISNGKRKLLNSKEALGKYSKYLK